MDYKEQILLRMREDIRLRGLSQNTLVNYTLHARIFLEFSNRPVEQLDAVDIRNFLWHLTNEKKASPATVNAYSAAIRFLFAITWNRTLNYLQIPRQKNRKTLPKVLTREEVFSIMENCKNIKHKAMLMVVYSSGLRVSEAATLKIKHIDSKNMRVFVLTAAKEARIVIPYCRELALLFYANTGRCIAPNINEMNVTYFSKCYLTKDEGENPLF